LRNIRRSRRSPYCVRRPAAQVFELSNCDEAGGGIGVEEATGCCVHSVCSSCPERMRRPRTGSNPDRKGLRPHRFPADPHVPSFYSWVRNPASQEKKKGKERKMRKKRNKKKKIHPTTPPTVCRDVPQGVYSATMALNGCQCRSQDVGSDRSLSPKNAGQIQRADQTYRLPPSATCHEPVGASHFV